MRETSQVVKWVTESRVVGTSGGEGHIVEMYPRPVTRPTNTLPTTSSSPSDVIVLDDDDISSDLTLVMSTVVKVETSLTDRTY
jgi:hypothetical protein